MITSFIKTGTVATFLLVLSIVATDYLMDPANAQDRARNGFEGEYVGKVLLDKTSEEVDVGVRVTNTGGNTYQATLYYGGLPDNGAGSDEQDRIELEGTHHDYTLKLTGDIPLTFQFIHNRITALDSTNSYRGHLDRVVPLQTGN
ncbi:MAG: hypothetical protein WD266_00535 [Balneolales bacterium]